MYVNLQNKDSTMNDLHESWPENRGGGGAHTKQRRTALFLTHLPPKGAGEIDQGLVARVD